MRHGGQDIHANDGDTAPRGVLARLNYAKVVATPALFVALGGKATAATLARDSVGAPQIKTDAVPLTGDPGRRGAQLGDPGGRFVAAGLFWTPRGHGVHNPPGFTRIREYVRNATIARYRVAVPQR